MVIGENANWGGRKVKFSLISRNTGLKNRVFRMGADWKIEEPRTGGGSVRWRTMYALWKREKIAGSQVRHWMFDRLLTAKEAEMYDREGDRNGTR